MDGYQERKQNKRGNRINYTKTRQYNINSAISILRETEAASARLTSETETAQFGTVDNKVDQECLYEAARQHCGASDVARGRLGSKRAHAVRGIVFHSRKVGRCSTANKISVRGIISIMGLEMQKRRQRLARESFIRDPHRSRPPPAPRLRRRRRHLTTATAAALPHLFPVVFYTNSYKYNYRLYIIISKS